MTELRKLQDQVDEFSKELHSVKHNMAQFPPQISGIYKNQEHMESQLSAIKVSVEAMMDKFDVFTTTINNLSTKMDGDEKIGYKGIRSRVEYLMTRDKWFHNKWLQATGAVGGVVIIYALFRTVDFFIAFLHKIPK